MTTLEAPSTARTVDFGGLRIEYDERVLAPRAWTAAQSEWAARLIRTAPPGPVLELCSGAGHIGLLAATLAPRTLICVDACAVACSYLRRNAARAGLRVDVRQGRIDDVLEPDERFAVIIADPPWVPTDEVDGFPEDPATAIDGGTDGLELTRACVEVFARHLVVAGSGLLQVGPGQAPLVRELVAAHAELAVVATRAFPRGCLVQIDRVTRSTAAA
jgi:methylase of polypeptide subunit release factors